MQRNKTIIIGGGIIGALEAYYTWLAAEQNHEFVRITIHEKNHSIGDTTVSNNVPSLTPDEILAVVAKGKDLLRFLNKPFNEPDGIRVEDVPNVNDTAVTKKFIAAVLEYSKDEAVYADKEETLKQLGKLSMQMWDDMYQHGDAKFKAIMEQSNYNPCRELGIDEPEELHKGYRVDLIFKNNSAINQALRMQADYTEMGYQQCKLLTPNEVMLRDKNLTDFCMANTHYDNDKNLIWNDDVAALWRPGGSINTRVFLPLLYEYLAKKMGDRFHLKFDRKVTEVLTTQQPCTVTGLKFFNRDKPQLASTKKYDHYDYIFCPGEAVGTLNELGFHEPAYAGFAGPTLNIKIPLTVDQAKQFAELNNYMELHQPGVVLAWQSWIKDGVAYIGIGGTKAYYADQKPSVSDAFVKNRNLLQLQAANDVLPGLLSIALGYDTAGKILTANDLQKLVDGKIAQCWTGIRAVTADNFPTNGPLYRNGEKVVNARTTTHLGSGGVSFGPATVFASRRTVQQNREQDELMDKVAQFGNSLRM